MRLFNLLFMMVEIRLRSFSFPITILIIFIGNLQKASFDMKTFANEMCRFICESVSDKIKEAIVLSTMSPRSFKDFQWYFRK